MSSPCSALVIFGITGDLARKKLFSSLYQLAVLNELDFPVVGVGRSFWSRETLRGAAGNSIDTGTGSHEPINGAKRRETLECLDYVQGSYDSAALYQELAGKLKHHEHILCYLAVPPAAFAVIVEGLGNSSIHSNVRLLLEKPFGHDRQSAAALSALVLEYFELHQVFAVDHYLQKESIQNLLVLRFANRIFEPLWNRSSIESVQIVMTETADIEGRGKFFDATGTLRDVVQNHGLQILTALAMESPSSPSTEDVDAARLQLLKDVQTLSATDVVFGQYLGYQQVDGVAPGSTTETFVEAQFRVDNHRWRGVVWSIVAGKALDRSSTRVVITFNPASDHSFMGETCTPAANQITLSLAPVEAVEICLQARSSALSMGTALTSLASTTNYRPDEHLDAYGRVFDGARRNDHTGFASHEVVDESWRIVDAVLRSTAEPHPYAKGSAGPLTEPPMLEV
jgi:glucose-6-phosphate 1-dehydrogenase